MCPTLALIIVVLILLIFLHNPIIQFVLMVVGGLSIISAVNSNKLTIKYGSGDELPLPAKVDFTMDMCCESSYALMDVVRRKLGWTLRQEDTSPVHYCLTQRPSLDYSRDNNYRYRVTKRLASLKSMADTDKMKKLVDKSELYKYIITVDPKAYEYIPVTWPLEDVQAIEPGHPLILKDENSSLQEGVAIIESTEKLLEFKKMVQLKGSKGIACELVKDPLMWYEDGIYKKFHMRVYLFGYYTAGVTKCYVSKVCKIYTAKLPYVEDSWDNLNIHLTGGSRSKKDYWWERDAGKHLQKTPEELAAVWASLERSMLRLFEATGKYILPYEESKSCYHMFGADVIPDKHGNAWLLEVNRNPSTRAINHDNRSAAFASMFANMFIDDFIKPHFGVGKPSQPLYVAESIKEGPLTKYAKELMGPNFAYVVEENGAWKYYRGQTESPMDELGRALTRHVIDNRKLPIANKPIIQYPVKPYNFSFDLTYSIQPPDDVEGANPENLIKEIFGIWGRLTKKIPLGGKKVHLAYVEPGAMNEGVGKQIHNQRASLKSILGNRNALCDKTKIYESLKAIGAERFMPRSRPLAEVTKLEPNEVIILKKRGSAGQLGVQVVDTQADLKRVKKEYNNDGIAQDYLADPLLSRGKKFHLRAYLLVYICDGLISAFYASDVHKIMTAKDKYKKGDWLNPNIHISGGSTTTEWLEWPWDIDESAVNMCTAQESLDVAMAAIGRVACENLIKYPESEGGFHVFGADIMFDKNYNAHILEVNDRPGLGLSHLDKAKYACLASRYLRWVSYSVLSRQFGTTYYVYPIYACAYKEAGPLTPYVDLLNVPKLTVSISPRIQTKTELRYVFRISEDEKIDIKITKDQKYTMTPQTGKYIEPRYNELCKVMVNQMIAHWNLK